MYNCLIVKVEGGDLNLDSTMQHIYTSNESTIKISLVDFLLFVYMLISHNELNVLFMVCMVKLYPFSCKL